MKNRITTIVLTLTITMYSANSFAASYVTANITSMTALAPYGVVYIAFDNDFTGDITCGNSARRAMLDASSPGMDQVYSLLLAAYIAGKSVRLTTVGCGTIYGNPAPSIYAAELLP